MLNVQNLCLSFADKPILNQFNLHMNEGEIVCLLGHSGCGKTTVLRTIAGFEQADSGVITLDHQILSDQHYFMPAHLRRVGMVFQDYALFPHLTVAQNIAFGLHKMSKSEQKQRIDELLTLIGLTEYAKRYPHQLSGGQQQRVALARALAPKPRLILLDEPFSNLDADLRSRLAKDIRDLLKQQQTAAIMVTHDRQEAFAMADYIGVLIEGSLQQYDTPYQLYHSPINTTIATFAGAGSLIKGVTLSQNQVQTALGILTSHTTLPEKQNVQVLIHPNDMTLIPVQDQLTADLTSSVKALITEREFSGSHFIYTLRLMNHEVIQVNMSSHDVFSVDSEVFVKTMIQNHTVFAE